MSYLDGNTKKNIIGPAYFIEVSVCSLFFLPIRVSRKSKIETYLKKIAPP